MMGGGWSSGTNPARDIVSELRSLRDSMREYPSSVRAVVLAGATTTREPGTCLLVMEVGHPTHYLTVKSRKKNKYGSIRKDAVELQKSIQ